MIFFLKVNPLCCNFLCDLGEDMTESRGLDGNHEKAKQWTHFAMKCLAETCERRRNDWLNEPPPRELLGVPQGGAGPAGNTLGTRMKRWSERQEKATKGDVFAELETTLAEVAVMQYALAFGKLRHSEVAIPMGQIIQDFPGTPMAKIAQSHIDRAKARMLEGLDRDTLDGFLRSPDSPDMIVGGGSPEPPAQGTPQPVLFVAQADDFRRAHDSDAARGLSWVCVFVVGLSLITASGVWGLRRYEALKRAGASRNCTAPK